MACRSIPLLLSLIWGVNVTAGAADAAPTGWLPNQTFHHYSPLAAKQELVPRVFAPTLADRFFRFERQAGSEAAEHSLNLSDERFDLFVPDRRPESGYGLLVFVAPVPVFRLSPDWKNELSKRGIIYVAARNSGNSENVLDRRYPLALHGYEHVVQTYAVNPKRVWITGFSGGSRIAQRLAVAYPDIFRGVMLIGGADAFGEAEVKPSLATWFSLFQERSKVVFATGGEDLPNRAKDERAKASFSEFCVANVEEIWVARIGHWVPDRRNLSKALEWLEAPPQSADEACIARKRGEIDAALDAIEAQVERGEFAAAGHALGELEQQVGGLAAPRSVALARTISEHLQDTAITE